MAKIIRVIETLDRRGLGQTENDPIRLIKQYWSLKGDLLWEDHDRFRVRRPLGCPKPGCYLEMGHDVPHQDGE